MAQRLYLVIVIFLARLYDTTALQSAEENEHEKSLLPVQKLLQYFGVDVDVTTGHSFKTGENFLKVTVENTVFKGSFQFQYAQGKSFGGSLSGKYKPWGTEITLEIKSEKTLEFEVRLGYEIINVSELLQKLQQFTGVEIMKRMPSGIEKWKFGVHAGYNSKSGLVGGGGIETPFIKLTYDNRKGGEFSLHHKTYSTKDKVK